MSIHRGYGDAYTGIHRRVLLLLVARLVDHGFRGSDLHPVGGVEVVVGVLVRGEGDVLRSVADAVGVMVAAAGPDHQISSEVLDVVSAVKHFRPPHHSPSGADPKASVGSAVAGRAATAPCLKEHHAKARRIHLLIDVLVHIGVGDAVLGGCRACGARVVADAYHRWGLVGPCGCGVMVFAVSLVPAGKASGALRATIDTNTGIIAARANGTATAPPHGGRQLIELKRQG